MRGMGAERSGGGVPLRRWRDVGLIRVGRWGGCWQGLRRGLVGTEDAPQLTAVNPRSHLEGAGGARLTVSRGIGRRAPRAR